MPVAVPLIGAAAGVASAAISKPKAAKDPYAYLRPYMNSAAGDAQSLYQQGGPQVYQGPTVADLSNTTQQALQAQLQRAQGGSPLIDQAQSFVQQGLSQQPGSNFGDAQNPYAQVSNPYAQSVGGGAQFDPYSRSVGGGAQFNPYASGQNPFGEGQNPGLDAAFNYAAQKSQNQLDSEYANSGRNTEAAAPARADMLSSLAAQIYAPAYESERNRQLAYGQQQLGIGAQGFESGQDRGLQARLAGQQIGSQGFQAGQQRNLQAGLAGQQIGAQSALQSQQIGAQGYENAQQRQLTDLNSQRAQQLGMLGYASPLAAQDYMDISQQRDVGNVFDQQNQALLNGQIGQFNQIQQKPYDNLQQLIANLSQLGGGTGQYPQPAPSPNYLSAGLGGAILGSSLYQPRPDPLAQYSITGAAANGGYKYPSSGGNADLYSSLGLL